MITIRKTFSYGDRTVVLETGSIARQATGAVLVSMGDTSVLVTVVGNPEPTDNRDFFPLSVHYQERFYSAGRIPGGFIKREGRPSTRETLIARLIDRPIRPLFPDGFYNEVQIVATVMSLDPDVEPDIPAMIGASAALAISGIPFTDIIAGARVGYINDSYLLNPTLKQLETSKLDLVVAGTKSAVLMVESQANELPEETMLKAVMFGHEQMQVVVQAISEFVEDVGKTKWNWAAVTFNIDLESKLTDAYENKILQAYSIREKLERRDEISKIYEEAVETFLSEENEDFSEYAIKNCFA